MNRLKHLDCLKPSSPDTKSGFRFTVFLFNCSNLEEQEKNDKEWIEAFAAWLPPNHKSIIWQFRLKRCRWIPGTCDEHYYTGPYFHRDVNDEIRTFHGLNHLVAQNATGAVTALAAGWEFGREREERRTFESVLKDVGRCRDNT